MLPKFEDEGEFNLKSFGCDTTNLHEYLISNNAVQSQTIKNHIVQGITYEC